ncbi:MAG TPA: response regulator [Roseiflexaceae bacterium]|nr:response regulator [Roseiflexaceae bacterium]HMP39969.1 response regulator [Roseiflexaceae bacterium]
MATFHSAPEPLVVEHILVVEDDESIRALCVRILQRSGYQVSAVAHGQAALDFLDHVQVDLVLTDLNMPYIDGMALLQRLRERRSQEDVIMLTAYGSIETTRAALKLGAVDFLTKPIAIDELLLAVRRALEVRRIRVEKQRLSEIITLYEISQALTTIRDTEQAVSEILALLSRYFNPAMIDLSLIHPDESSIEILACHGRTTHAISCPVDLAGGEAAIVAAHTTLVGGCPNHPASHQARLILRSGDRIIGVLQLLRQQIQPPFDFDDHTLLAVCASQIAVALDNSRLYKRLIDQSMETIIALAAAIDARDPYTHGHSEQVAHYAVCLAESIGIEPQRIERLRIGALMHDIGKIGIRDHILLKPGPLTPDERAIMETHASIGAEMLANISSLHDILPIIRSHHERIDGYGYPDHLAGDRIPLEARIVAIADAFDTMTSHRAYRPSLPLDVALAELRRGRGTQWDATLVDHFMALIDTRWETLRFVEVRRPQVA